MKLMLNLEIMGKLLVSDQEGGVLCYLKYCISHILV